MREVVWESRLGVAVVDIFSVCWGLFVYLWKVWCEGWYEVRYGAWYHQSSVIGRRLCVRKRGVHGRRGLAILRQK